MRICRVEFIAVPSFAILIYLIKLLYFVIFKNYAAFLFWLNFRLCNIVIKMHIKLLYICVVFSTFQVAFTLPHYVVIMPCESGDIVTS